MSFELPPCLEQVGNDSDKEASKLHKNESITLGPLGYLKVKDSDGRVRMTKDPKTYPLIQEALELRKRGRSYKYICKVMEKKGLRTRSGKIIPPNVMVRILGD